MEKKKKLTYFFVAITIIFAIFILFNIVKVIKTGNQKIQITSAVEFYSGSKFEAVLNVLDNETSYKIASKVKVNLLDSNHKKIKNAEIKFNTNENETANIILDLPETLEEGTYYVQAKCSSKRGTDVTEKQISIKEEKKRNRFVRIYPLDLTERQEVLSGQ